MSIAAKMSVLTTIAILLGFNALCVGETCNSLWIRMRGLQIDVQNPAFDRGNREEIGEA